ncbi:protein PYRICULARIA ORYZAE RESISTANCE 21-like [Panicum virgatum]|uniref:Uncharacterized protein n=1 Tax=Panicum virgatum TaxID=38727 RepID=A0A8T0PZZ1_PANVG|nr:protein PYRICULARIA ORYZAE RESISTANCE 21-like [Panicum virgatum]KAG2565922.1 hypothetical protein PVAP13_7NG149800 [Panicum virgatum]
MPTLIITVDLECCRCSSKIQKVLCCIQDRGEFVIEKIVYENDKVLVSGPFDADKLSSKLCCKAGRIIKKIEVAKPPKNDPPKCPKKEPVTCTAIYPYPYPYPCPQPAWPCKPPKEEPKPKPEPPSCKMIYPDPYPYPCSQPWPCSCPSPHCVCQSKPAPPPPEPPKPPACQCQCPAWSPCYCSGGGMPACQRQCPAWLPCYCSGGYPPYMPPPTMLVCDDSPPYGACTIM